MKFDLATGVICQNAMEFDSATDVICQNAMKFGLATDVICQNAVKFASDEAQLDRTRRSLTQMRLS